MSYENYDEGLLAEKLQEAKSEVEKIESALQLKKERSRQLEERLMIVRESKTGDLSDADISDLVKKIKVENVLYFLRTNYDYKPADLGVIGRTAEIRSKSLASIAVGLDQLKKTEEDQCL